MKLSDKLRNYRSDRPDEWAMDDFIRLAEELEGSVYTHTYNDYGVKKLCNIISPIPDANTLIVVKNAYDEYILVCECDVYIK